MSQECWRKPMQQTKFEASDTHYSGTRKINAGSISGMPDVPYATI